MMSDSVYTVFKTLIKIPVYTAIAYIIFNCFAFSTAYYRMLGMSHAVQMMVMEDNFLTQADVNVLADEDGIIAQLVTSLTPSVQVVDSQDTSIADSDTATIAASDIKVSASVNSYNNTLFEDAGDVTITTTSVDVDTARTQFGTTRAVGLVWRYRPIFPLIPTEQVNSGPIWEETGDAWATAYSQGAVGGWDNFNSPTPSQKAPTDIDIKLHTRSTHCVTIRMLYKVPGLKYYPDIDL